jgi:hypothetical protein
MKKIILLALIVLSYSSYAQKPPLVQKFKDKGPIMMWFPNSNTTLKKLSGLTDTSKDNSFTQGQYLVKSGKYKNASIVVAGITTGLTALILSNPTHNTTEYNMQVKTAGFISFIGGGISLGLNITGNNMLIKAGLAKQK